LSVLDSFSGPDGEDPYAGVIFDPEGNLYGTTWVGGPGVSGTVFELSPAGTGTWTHTILHAFNGQDGSFVYAGLVFDRAGNAYGTTDQGGGTGCEGEGCGTVYEVIP
jgi:uncharacterized repeat protein (TIGR03803 family)